MIVLETWSHHPFAIAIGRTVLHSLWEGAIAAIVLAVLVRALHTSNARYLAACAALFAIAGTAIATSSECIEWKKESRRHAYIAAPSLPRPDGCARGAKPSNHPEKLSFAR